ncbi:MAG: pirin family protein, partial [Chitinophagaceae bacterium]
HKEYHETEFSKKGGIFEMVQLWVNLPKKDKGVASHYQALTAAEMGKITLPDNAGSVNVIAGDANGTKGAASTYTDVNLFDIKLNKGGLFTTNVPSTHNTALLMIKGSAVINGENAPEHSFTLMKNEGEEITIQAGEDTVILLMSGEPIDEPIASYGPFVMNTQAEIYEAIEEFQNGKYGELV